MGQPSSAAAIDLPLAPAEQLTRVTLGLCDGGERSGSLRSFSPHGRFVMLWERYGEGQGTRISRIDSVAVAYIAFHGPGPDRVSRETVGDPVDLRVHVVGGVSLFVRAGRAGLSGGAGFYAEPLSENQGEHQRYYFFGHGVEARERADPMGAMLAWRGRRDGRAAGGSKGEPADRKPRLQKPIGEILSEHEAPPDDAERARVLQERRRIRIGDALIAGGLVSQADLDAALAEQSKRPGKRLGEILVELGTVSELGLYHTLGQIFEMPVIDIDDTQINPAAVAAVTPDIIRKYHVLPVHIDEATMVVAISDPLNVEVYDVLRFQVSRRIVEALAPRSQIAHYIETNLDGMDTDEVMVDAIIQEMEDEASSPVEESLTGEFDVSASQADGVVVRLVNKVILDAHRLGASDIHIEPNGGRDRTLVRFRVDGVCSLYHEIPSEYRRSLVSRIKILAGLDIAERRQPQDGKIRLRTPEGPIELRVATIPTIGGNEDVVLRLLGSQRHMSLADMGMNERNLAAMKSAVMHPHGLLLCVGPTGSGKTTTLHAALASINNSERKIWTAEDPVEITQRGLRQVQVNPKIGFTFAAALRAFLRADPDVIMIGEMRDEETASIAVESSLTGHLVLSTLHTNSAPETVVRLLDMGLDPFAFADALRVVLAQRLARRNCEGCREPYAASAEEYEQIRAWYGQDALERGFGVSGPDTLRLWRCPGCERCAGTGSKGRVALHELLVVDSALRRAVQQRASADEIRDLAAAGGMATLLQDGIEKVLLGDTTVKHVLSVTGG